MGFGTKPQPTLLLVHLKLITQETSDYNNYGYTHIVCMDTTPQLIIIEYFSFGLIFMTVQVIEDHNEVLDPVTLTGSMSSKTVTCVRVRQEAARRYILERRDEILQIREVTDNDEDALRQLEARVSSQSRAIFRVDSVIVSATEFGECKVFTSPPPLSACQRNKSRSYRWIFVKFKE